MRAWQKSLVGIAAVTMTGMGIAVATYVFGDLAAERPATVTAPRTDAPREHADVARAAEYVMTCVLEDMVRCPEAEFVVRVATVLEATKSMPIVKDQCVENDPAIARKDAWHRGFCDGRWGNEATDDGLKNRMTTAWTLEVAK